MILIFDTETTGFPSKDKPADHPAQAHICQIAWLVLDDNLREVRSFKSLVRSNGKWQIGSGAQGAHGISQIHADKYGAAIEHIMPLFNDTLLMCKKVVAHNIKFDRQLIDIESSLLGISSSPDVWSKSICTMEVTTPLCKLPSQRQQWKWPKLSEAYQHFFGEELKGAHDALADVKATARIFKHLVDNRHIIL